MYLTTTEVAKLANVSDQTVRNYIHNNKLVTADKKSKSGGYLITGTNAKRFVKTLTKSRS